MTQRDRDRLVALKKARKGLITQRQAAEEIGQSERNVRRLLKRLAAKGDKGIVHGSRGVQSNRRLDEKVKGKALEILRRDVYSGCHGHRGRDGGTGGWPQAGHAARMKAGGHARSVRHNRWFSAARSIDWKFHPGTDNLRRQRLRRVCRLARSSGL